MTASLLPRNATGLAIAGPRITKTCFVISAIGAEGSETRQAADDFFDLIVQPATERFHFSVVRADKLASPGTITSQIVELVQNAELCVVDLTGHNANVYYECGRRHETARPVIQLIRIGEELPFDLAGVRTIFYDLSTAHSTRKAVKLVQTFVEEFEQIGYAAASSGVSASTLSQAIDRIERKVDKVLLGGVASGPAAAVMGPAGGGLKEILKSPREAFFAELSRQNVPGAIRQLQRIRDVHGVGELLVTAAGMLASAGYEEGMLLLVDLLENSDGQFEDTLFRAAVSSTVQFYGVTDREAEGITRLEPVITRRLRQEDISDEEKAYFLNQLQKLYWGAQRFEDAQRLALQALELNPHITYKYNLSLVYEARGLLDLAEQTVDDYMRQGTDDYDHLMQAYDIYSARGRHDDARAAFQRAEQIDPDRAALKQLLD